MSAVGSILTNTGALEDLNSLSAATNKTSSLETQLSTGLSINAPADNPAGSIEATGFTSQINGSDQAITNINTGISLASTAQGAIGQQINIAQRLYSLAVQAANGTETSVDRNSLQSVASQLIGEIGTIANQTTFNGKNLLTGSFSNVQFQTGANNGQTQSLSISATTPSQIGNRERYISQSQPPLINRALHASSMYQYGSGTLGLTSVTGEESISTTKGESAKKLAQAINQNSSSVGITATADTKVTLKLTNLNEFNQPNDNYNFVLNTWGSSSGYGPSELFTGHTGSSLVSKINAQEGIVGISASLNSSGSLVLNQSSGKNIILSDFNPASFAGLAIGSDLVNMGVDTVYSDGSIKPTNGPTGPYGYNPQTEFQGVVQLAGSQSFSIKNGSLVGIDDPTVTAASAPLSKPLSSINLSTQSGAQAAISVIKSSIQDLEGIATSVGTFQDGLQTTLNNLQTSVANQTAALSTVQDANIPALTNQLSESQIQAQSGVAALKESSQLQQSYMSLLP